MSVHKKMVDVISEMATQKLIPAFLVTYNYTFYHISFSLNSNFLCPPFFARGGE